MNVILFSEEEQVDLLENYNRDKKKHEVIPLMPRNLNTGWPLIQASLFSVDPENCEQYIPILGGGRCHDLNIGAFNFATLLTKIPGPMDIEINDELSTDKISVKKELLRPECIDMFLCGYNALHKTTGISIASHKGMYGPVDLILVPEGNSKSLGDKLYFLFDFAIASDESTESMNFAQYSAQVNFTSSQIERIVKRDVAILSNGQIYIDLGEFLKTSGIDSDAMEYLKVVFGVDSLQMLLKSKDLLKPKTEASKEPAELEQSTKEAPDTAPTSTGPSFFNTGHHDAQPTVQKVEDTVKHLSRTS